MNVREKGFPPPHRHDGRNLVRVTFRSQRPLDGLDWRILDELQADGRLSFKELGRRINLSAPAVAERVRRLRALDPDWHDRVHSEAAA